MYGPLRNRTGQTGAAAVTGLRDRVQSLAQASRAGVDAMGPWVIVPAPTQSAEPAGLSRSVGAVR